MFGRGQGRDIHVGFGVMLIKLGRGAGLKARWAIGGSKSRTKETSVGQPIDPAVDSADYEVHEMHDAPEVITQTGGYPGESSHARGEEAPSSYIDDVLLMTEDELRQIQEGTLSAISFGLDSLMDPSKPSSAAKRIDFDDTSIA
ncbi:hypothetical protein SUGI_0072970 [Cryptomeria japonica]|nr:hypothetical protein SUGI_0072970 [Cryptomeria japonica]